MNDKFDELTRSMAQSVTRRAALKKFGVGLAGVVLAALGLAGVASARSPNSRSEAAGPNRKPGGFRCNCQRPPYYGCDKQHGIEFYTCVNGCVFVCLPH